MMFTSQISSTVLLAASAVSAGNVLWDGRFTDTSAADLDKWSFSNPVGAYQYYIHGKGETAEYVSMSADFKNPADSASKQGVKISLTDSAFWNGQNMRRTELIPQTKEAINKGKVYYHFSMKRSETNAPVANREHQIAFFESHFTEMKAGSNGDADPALRWFADSKSQWDTAWDADVWHNMAYEIDFDASTVGLWHSTGADALKQVVKPVKASTSSNGADWHLGMLELPGSGSGDKNEDIFFSGVYIESGDLTTSIGSGSAAGSADAPPAAAKPVASSTAIAKPIASSTAIVSSAAPTTLATSTKAPATSVAATSSAAQATASAKPKPKCRKRKARSAKRSA
ncbi:carbohydrate-binding module family 1 protein [Apiospora rasikravindrae]|uniref:Carbohydrate-binding module family 1 protein n=1 Tax=Apiospora rasikravindrae TaxID=990691 RepID=A0ABR1TF96_9PEZI